jgi:hypothetical protein
VYLQAGDVFLMSTGEMVHAAMKSSMQPCTGVLPGTAGQKKLIKY